MYKHAGMIFGACQNNVNNTWFTEQHRNTIQQNDVPCFQLGASNSDNLCDYLN